MYFYQKIFTYFLFIVFLFPPLISFAESSAVDSSVGFVPGNIWYSNDNPQEGEITKIYTALWNSAKESISGKITFFDRNIILGEKTFTIAPSSVNTISIDWLVTHGDHLIYAKIFEFKTSNGGALPSNISLGESETKQIETFVKKNTDQFKPTENTPNSTSGSFAFLPAGGNSISQILNNAGNIFDDPIITTVKDKVASTFKKIDSYRTDKQGDIANNVNSTPKDQNYKKLFWQSLNFFFSNKLLFYIVIISLALLLFRLIRNKLL